MADDESWRNLLRQTRELLDDEEWAEFNRLLQTIREEQPETLITPETYASLVGTVMFNLGRLNQQEIEEILRD